MGSNRVNSALRWVAILAVLSSVFVPANASLGDRLPEFQDCVEVWIKAVVCKLLLTETGVQSRELCSWERPSA